VDAGDPPLTEWRQGDKTLGPWATHRFVHKTYADAGTINTNGGTGHFRDISNEVFVGARKPTVKIERVAEPSAGRPGLEVCMSGAYGGYGCGPIDKVGHGRTPSGLHRGYDYVLNGRLIRNVYRFRRESGSCKGGDSGAPVFRLTGTAMGIAFAKSRNGQHCLFSQQSWVEYELNVKTYTGDSDGS